MKIGLIIRGFLLAPLAPAITFVILAATFGIVLDFKEGGENIAAVLFGSIFWLMYSLPASYALTFACGLPMFLAFKKMRLNSLRTYLIGPSILGSLLSLIPLYYELTNTSWFLFLLFGGAFFGALTGVVFWFLVYKLPNPSFNPTADSSFHSHSAAG